ncbi:MAG: arginine--tRNA ligase, partial [Candidatus Nanohaloarchaea archaeon]
EEMDEDEELVEKGREWAEKIEAGNEEARSLWERFREESIAYHRKDYERMGVHFDRFTGESQYVEKAKEVLEEGLEKGVFERETDGSVSIEFEKEELPSIVVQKADGTSLYLTRDLATLKERVEEEGFDHNLYVVGSEQKMHFRQLFRAAEMMGYDTSGCEHVSYGLLDLPEGSMSSREGRIIRLSDVMDEAEKKAEEKLEEEGKDLDVAEEVGIGAVKYANLKVSRNKNIEFDWDQVLSFEGDSGPYLQYSNTRAKSILEKADEEGEITGMLDDGEYRLLKKLSRFPEKVEAAAENREPAKLANYLSNLAEEFNSFYHEKRVLDADTEEDRLKRLELVGLFVEVTDTGLELLGIEPLEEM